MKKSLILQPLYIYILNFSDNTLTNDPLGVNPPAQLPHSLATPHPGEDEGLLQLGMISHKNSLITIFGYKHKIKNFTKKIDIFHENISMAFGFWCIFGIKLLILKQNYIKMINEF